MRVSVDANTNNLTRLQHLERGEHIWHERK